MTSQPKVPTKRICSGRVLASCVAILQMRRSATTSSETRWSKPSYGPSREDFVVEAGWVANVSEKYRSAVAKSCALTVVEGMEAPTTKPAG